MRWGRDQTSNVNARGRLEITSLITPEFYDTKSYYQLILSKQNAKISVLENLLM